MTTYITEQKLIFVFSVATVHPFNYTCQCTHMNTDSDLILQLASVHRVINILATLGWGRRTGGVQGPNRLHYLVFDTEKRGDFTYVKEKSEKETVVEDKENDKRSHVRDHKRL